MSQRKLALKEGVSIRIINIDELEAVVVEDYLCTLFLGSGETGKHIQSLKEILSILPVSFVKISRNTIVDSEKIKAIDLRKREICMESGQCFRFSVRKIKEVKDLLLKP